MDSANQSVGSTIKAIGTRLFRKRQGAKAAPVGELSRYRAILESVRDFMLRHVVEPNPANYALVYRHTVAQEPHLDEAVATMIESGYAPVGEVGGEGLSEHELTQIAEQAQENLKAVESLVRRSTEDTQGFGEALESHIARSPAIDALINLTRTMISKTRAAEEELRLRGQAMTDLQMSLSEARVKADTDVLTGLNNRRAFERHLGAAGARAAISGRPLSLGICDIDHFKKINDTHGHCTGDRVLQFVSGLLRESCGSKSHVSRHGGEEFVIVFEETTAEQGYEVIDAVRRDLRDRKLIDRESGEPLGPVSFSAGVSALEPNKDVSSMLRSADRALYQAKASGRDQVILATGDRSNS